MHLSRLSIALLTVQSIRLQNRLAELVPQGLLDPFHDRLQTRSSLLQLSKTARNRDCSQYGSASWQADQVSSSAIH